jgi:predicted enzyme related to lactoylglutathione lyase
VTDDEGTMKIRGTDFVMYPVSDLARAAAFYRETLGLPQEVYSEEWQWAEFNCGNVTLSLHGGVQLPEVIGGGRIALAVDDIQAACAELKRQGVRVLGEPTDYSVCRAVEILDPDGNTVILHQRADGTWGQAGSGE